MMELSLVFEIVAFAVSRSRDLCHSDYDDSP
jgi:hypothetical protein